jgi:hypothetical protein
MRTLLVQDDTVVIDEKTTQKSYEKYFIAQIGKCDDIVAQVAKISI